MKFGSAYLASALAATAFLAAPAATQQTDWSKRITVSAKGGHIKGNPLAKHQVAEYMSYTCNHCANFEKESYLGLRDDYIKKGHVSFEVRNLILNPIDLTAAMLARCGGRTKFFGNHRALLIQQPIWLAKFQSTPASVMKTLNEGTVPQRLKKIAKGCRPLWPDGQARLFGGSGQCLSYQQDGARQGFGDDRICDQDPEAVRYAQFHDQREEPRKVSIAGRACNPNWRACLNRIQLKEIQERSCAN